MLFEPSRIALDLLQGTVDQENDVGQNLAPWCFGQEKGRSSNYLRFLECDDIGSKSLHGRRTLATKSSDLLVLAPWVSEAEFTMTWLPLGKIALQFWNTITKRNCCVYKLSFSADVYWSFRTQHTVYHL